MSFIRPEVAEALKRWKDVVVGASIGLFGLWLATQTYGIRSQFGAALILVAVALIYSGLQRARRPKGSGGPGVVEVDERQITYFGPEDGGAVSIDALSHIDVVASGEGDRASDFLWVFHQPDAPPLYVPGNAEGAQDIFDALAALPDVDFEGVIAVSKSRRAAQRRIWAKDRDHRALT